MTKKLREAILDVLADHEERLDCGYEEKPHRMQVMNELRKALLEVENAEQKM